MIAATSGSVPWWGAVIAVAVGAALSQGVNMLNSAREAKLERRRWHRDRIERAFVDLLAAGEECRQAQVDFKHQRGGQEVLEETMRRLAATRPLIRITATEPSIFATDEYVKAVAHVNEVLTEGGDLEAAFEEAATTMQMVEIMARREAGLADLPYEKMARVDTAELADDKP